MRHLITRIEKGSIAEELGIRPGDYLLSINGREVIDWLDYQAFSCAEVIDLLTAREDEEIEYSLAKDEYEPLGLCFDSQLMGPVRDCINKCLFCFVDQLPEHVRPSLRVKDDDWRLSMMMGNYVTMTNVSDRELSRIIERHASPLYISVHATEPALRARLLGQPLAAKLMDQLRRLKEGGIQFHAQAVLCPGINDGEALERTIRDLKGLMPACRSLALVPVGLTGHREGLYELHPYTQMEARAVIEQAARWQKVFLEEYGFPFIYPSDEFYLQAGMDVPEDEFYGDYEQIENGVGLVRLLRTEFHQAYEEADLSAARPARLILASGMSAAPLLTDLLARHPIPGVRAEVVAVDNQFFGESVTVSGLVTGGDLIRVLAGREKPDKVLIPEKMLRETEDVFLDDMTLEAVEKALGVPVVKVPAPGEDLLRALMFA